MDPPDEDAPEATLYESGRQYGPHESDWSITHNKFVKDDKGKPRWSLLPWEALEHAVIAMENGAKSRGKDNWRLCDDPDRYYDAFMRHLTAHRRGHTIDKDSGDLALGHAIASLLIYVELELANGLDQ